MNVLYGGAYRSRAKKVFSLVGPEVKQVNELCFGDVLIAEACRQRGIGWQGFDCNEEFVNYACKQGYHAVCANLLEERALPKAEVCIMMGSFYHFYNHEETILRQMLQAAPVVILSEPIRNWSSRKGPLGLFARWASKTGKSAAHFRFTEASFITLLNNLSKSLRFRYDIVEVKKDLIVRITHENG